MSICAGTHETLTAGTPLVGIHTPRPDWHHVCDHNPDGTGKAGPRKKTLPNVFAAITFGRVEKLISGPRLLTIMPLLLLSLQLEHQLLTDGLIISVTDQWHTLICCSLYFQAVQQILSKSHAECLSELFKAATIIVYKSHFEATNKAAKYFTLILIITKCQKK